MISDDLACAAEQRLGMEVRSAEADCSEISMKIRDDMLNGHDVCHGGSIYALAHAAFRHACLAAGETTGTESCTIEFLKSGRIGDQLTANAKLRARSDSIRIFDVTVMNQDDVVVALFQGNRIRT